MSLKRYAIFIIVAVSLALSVVAGQGRYLLMGYRGEEMFSQRQKIGLIERRIDDIEDRFEARLDSLEAKDKLKAGP